MFKEFKFFKKFRFFDIFFFVDFLMDDVIVDLFEVVGDFIEDFNLVDNFDLIDVIFLVIVKYCF